MASPSIRRFVVSSFFLLPSSVIQALALLDPTAVAGRTLYALGQQDGDDRYKCFKVVVGQRVELMTDGVLAPPDFRSSVCKLLWRKDFRLGTLASRGNDLQGAQNYIGGEAGGFGAGCSPQTLESDRSVDLSMTIREDLDELWAIASEARGCHLRLRLEGSLGAFGLSDSVGAQACTCVTEKPGVVGAGGGCYSEGILCVLRPDTFSVLPIAISNSTAAAASRTKQIDGFLENVLNRGRCIAVGPDWKLYTSVCRWTVGSTADRWIFREDGFIESQQYPGKCIDVEGDLGLTSGLPIQISVCEFGWSASDQIWDLRQDGLIESRLRRGMCVDVVGHPAGWADKGLVLSQCALANLRSDQRWMVAQAAGEPEPNSVLMASERASSPVANGILAIQPTPTPATAALGAGSGRTEICFLENALTRGKCLGVNTWATPVPFEGKELVLSDCNFGVVHTFNRWKLRDDGFIESMADPGKCIDVRGNPATHNGAALQLRTCEMGWVPEATDQRWTLRSDGLIENLLSPGKCVDIDGARGSATKVGTKVQLWDCEPLRISTDQRWMCTDTTGAMLAAGIREALERARPFLQRG